MKHLFFATVLFSAATCALAQVTVAEPWVRGTVPLQEATGAFMQLNSQTGTRLIEAASPVARVEIHEMSMHGDVMRMKQVDSLELQAGKTVELKPGSYHLMLTGLKQQLQEGGTVPVTLIFQDKAGKRETLEVGFPVRALTASAAKMKNDRSGH